VHSSQFSHKAQYRQASARFAEISQKIDEIDIKFAGAASRLDRIYAKLQQDILQGADKENRSTNLTCLQASDRKEFAIAAQKAFFGSKTVLNFLMQSLNCEIAEKKTKPFAKILLEKFSKEKSAKALLQLIDEIKAL
jgi:predicted transcriptional regulator